MAERRTEGMMEKDRWVMIERILSESRSASEATHCNVNRRTYPAGQGWERAEATGSPSPYR